MAERLVTVNIANIFQHVKRIRQYLGASTYIKVLQIEIN